MTQSTTPEQDKLMDRLFGDPKRQALNFHVSWGPEAHLVSAEERCAQLNRVFDAIEAGEYEEIEPPFFDDFEQTDVKGWKHALGPHIPTQ